MTANQIKYAEHRETQRHNKVSERHEHYDTRTRRMASEAQLQQAATAEARLAEDSRHNRETERVNWWDKQATYRENVRHNTMGEAISAYSARTDAEYKHKQSEASLYQASASLRQASVAETNAQTRKYEAESGRIQAQASLAHASAAHAQVALGYSQLAESIKHNREQEALGYYSKQQDVALGRSQLAAQVGHNMQVRSETQRHNQAVESETSRTNVANESIRQQQADAAKSQAKAANRQANAAVVNSIGNFSRNIVSAMKVGGML